MFILKHEVGKRDKEVLLVMNSRLNENIPLSWQACKRIRHTNSGICHMKTFRPQIVLGSLVKKRSCLFVIWGRLYVVIRSSRTKKDLVLTLFLSTTVSKVMNKLSYGLRLLFNNYIFTFFGRWLHGIFYYQYTHHSRSIACLFLHIICVLCMFLLRFSECNLLSS